MCCCSLASNSIRWSALRSSPVFELMLCGHQNQEKKPSSYMCVLRNIKSRFSQIIIQFSALAEWAEERVRRKIQQTNIYFIQIRNSKFIGIFRFISTKQRSDKRSGVRRVLSGVGMESKWRRSKRRVGRREWEKKSNWLQWRLEYFSTLSSHLSVSLSGIAIKARRRR